MLQSGILDPRGPIAAAQRELLINSTEIMLVVVVPVILMTRSAQPADYATSHQLGAMVCMAKPFKPERLQQVVRLVAPPPALRDAPPTRVV